MTHFFFIIILLTLGFTSKAYGAQVVYIGQHFIIIDAGSEHGLSKNDEVCLNWKTTNGSYCGNVAAIRPRVSGVKLTPPEGVKVGVKISGKTLVDDGTKKASKAEIQEFIANISKQEKKDPQPPPQKPLKPSPGENESKTEIYFGFLYTPFLPFEHQVPRYEIDRQIERSGSLWASDLKVRSTASGFQGGLHYPVSTDWFGSISWKYRMIFKDSLEVDYDPTDPEIYANIATSTSSYGLSLSASRKTWTKPWMNILTAAGLDFDRSNVSVHVTSQGGVEEAHIASLQRMLTILSLKLGSSASFPLLMDKAGVSLSLHALLPFHEMKQVSERRQTLRPEVNNEQRQNSPKDLEKALGHKRTNFGFEIGVHAFYKI